MRGVGATESSNRTPVSMVIGGEDMPTPITRKGYEALKAELDRLHKVERPRVIEAIAEAARMAI